MENIAELSLSVPPLAPDCRINEVGEIFLDHQYERLLSLPVVQDGWPVGVISRASMQKIFMTRFGRELQGNKPVAEFMNLHPLLVRVDQPMEEASRYVTRNISFPITEDFIIVKEGAYHGVGSVVGLLRGMEDQVKAQNASLSRALAELKSSQAQLVQSEKMASLGQMVAGVAHEINTPLGYVKNNIEMAGDAFQQMLGLNDSYAELLLGLQSGEMSDEEIHLHLGSIAGQRETFDAMFPRAEMAALFSDTLYGLGQISEIVVNLKNFSRLDQAAVDQVDLNACIDSALTIGRNVTKHKAEVIRQFGELPRIRCAPSHINQVILNLVTNAAHAITQEPGRIVIRTQADSRHVHIVVTDNGKGIAPEHLEKIFDPFFTTKPVGEGTGLGLSIAYRIVKEHGGDIRVKSEVGRGTAFCISLPIQPASSQKKGSPS